MTPLSLHPTTIKMLKNAHPWVTNDSYSKLFPKKKQFLELYCPKTKQYFGQFLHDPDHPNVKARFWGFEKTPFKKELIKRVILACKKRNHLMKARDNIYLCFGESDSLPGLFAQKLGNILLIQFTAFFWEKELATICDLFLKDKTLSTLGIEHVWIQKRIPGEKKDPPTPLSENNQIKTITENQIKFELRFNQGHDIGIYTDMATIRNSILPILKKSNNILNLFSYTGAFSLMGLKYKKTVTSVDLSRHYMEWLEKNIQLNQFANEKHHSFVLPCEKAIQKFIKRQELFDLIICDPPSFSSDGKKKISAMNFYKKNIQHIMKCLSPNGYLIIFLNTHNISRKKFRSVIEIELSKIPNTKATIIKELSMDADCKPLPDFPEGDYLKGLVIKNVSQVSETPDS